MSAATAKNQSEPVARRKRRRNRPVPLSELPPDVWEAEHVAAYLGRGVDWVYRRKAEGVLPYRQHANGRPWYVPREIVRWFNDNGRRG